MKEQERGGDGGENYVAFAASLEALSTLFSIITHKSDPEHTRN